MGLSKYLYDKEKNPEGSFHLLCPETFEDADKIFYSFAHMESPPSLVVVDSITGMIPGKLIDKSIEEIEPGLQARYTSVFLMKYKHMCRDKKITVCFVNQVRTQIRFRGSSTVEPSGGMALKHMMDVRLLMEASEKLEKETESAGGKEKIPYGAVNNIFALKNRFAPPFVPLPIAIYFGKGISNTYTYLDYLKKYEAVKMSSNGVYSITLPGLEKISARGLHAAEKAVKENLEAVKKFIQENGGFKLIHSKEE